MPETATETVTPEPTTEIPPVFSVTETIDAQAQSLSVYVFDWVCRLGLPAWTEPLITGSILLLCLIVLAFLIFFIIRPFILKIATAMVKRTSCVWDDKVIKYGVAKWASHFVSALLLNFLIPGFFRDTPMIGRYLLAAGQVYLVISGLLMINSILNGMRAVFDKTGASEKLPATSLVQVLRLLAFVIAIILVVSTLAGKSPVAFLGGLGVFTSIIMLVFKDAILGFVAGIQLTTNDMIREGDWIEMPRHGADGNVTEVGLTTVKVMNWDKTTTTIPTYDLISESFKNWRTMPESGGRRIKRSIYINVNSVELCDDEMLAELRKISLISEYIDNRLTEIDTWNNEHGFDHKNSIVNGRQLTNIGTFRAYILAYLKQHPFIHSEGMTLLVRQLDSGPNGIPVEVYCFSNEVNWARYEEIQSDIFDHLFAVATHFGLDVFQNPTSIDSHTEIQLHGLHHTAKKKTTAKKKSAK